MLLLRPGDDPILVGYLHEAVRVEVDGFTREVRIAHHAYTHIVEQRTLERAWHPELVLSRLAEVIGNPTHMGRRSGDPRRVEVYKRVDGDPCGVCVCIKCLEGESWVNTAFPMGARSLQKHLRTGKLWALDEQGTLFTD